jgi:uncharacterized membrane protein YbhN (UPF0104 family)
LVRGFQLAVAVGLLVIVWRIAGGDAALTLLGAADPMWLIAAVAALSAQVFLSARRWQITAGQLGITVTFSTALREYYLAQLVNQALPGGVLGDASRAVRARGYKGLLAAGQSVVFERLSGQVALFGLMLVAIAVTMLIPGELDWPRGAPTVLLAVVGLLIALPVALWLVLRTLPAHRTDTLRLLGRSAKTALLGRGVVAEQLVLSVATALANIAGFVFCARAIGADLGWVVALAVVPLILLTMLIPVTISGWGLREAAAAAVFPLAGLATSEGLASSVAFGLVLIVISLPGLVFARPAPGHSARSATPAS